MPSLLEALERKYCLDGCQFDEANSEKSDSDSEHRLISIFIPRLPPLMCVPELLVLNDCDIDHAGDFETIKDKCQRVRELDLAQNRLQDWKEVFHILHHMPRIEFLNLSRNHLNGPITQFFAPTSIGNLKSIVLNGTYLDWLCVEHLLSNLPQLDELHLSLNNYKEVLIDADADADGDDDGNITTENTCNTTTNSSCARQLKLTKPHRALKTLHFTGNPVEHWREVCRLGRVFPCLENLLLADCPIKSIQTSCDENTNTPSADNETDTNTNTTTNNASDQPHAHFPNLKFLNLSYANIATWQDVDLLAAFPKLDNLRVKNWPLWDRLECTEHERRQLLIARLPNVRLLNGGGHITADERETSERFFIRHYMDKPEAERPPRYDELIAKHGRLDPLVNINLKPDKHVQIYLTFDNKTETKTVDINRTVADLKVKLEKIVGLPANKMRLYYLDQDYKDFGPEEMKYPNKLLYSYNIQNGDEIIIDRKK